MTEEEETRYLERLPEIQRYEREFHERSQNRDLDELYWVPIKAHVIRTTAGTGGLDSAALGDALAHMNTFYNNAYINFYICNGINYIDDDTYYNFDTSEETAMTTAHQVAGLINIYFTDNVTSGASNLCGYAYFPGGPDVILMDNACTVNGSTLIHEMGHFFYLSHTHGGTANELVDGSNCLTDGDYLCDTPADPTLGTGNVNTSCVYTGVGTDANGQAYTPSPINIMSYSRKSCRTELTTDQYARAYGAYHSDRNVYNCPTFSVDFTANVTSTCNSTLSVNFTDASTGATSWQWDVDGDGTTDYTTQNCTHNFTTSGSYDVRLTVSNGTYTISKTEQEFIQVGALGSIPYSETFETFTSSTSAGGYTNSWSTSPGNTNSAYRWDVSDGDTPSGSTGAEVDATTNTAAGKFLYTEASGYSTGDLAYVYSPCLDLNASEPEVSFDYHLHGASMGTLYLDIDAGSGWVNLVTLTGQQQANQTDAWQTSTTDLTAYSNQVVQFRFRGSRGTNYTSDMCIDDFALANASTAAEIQFSASTSSSAESSADGTSGCRGYRDISIPLEILNAPTGDAIVTFSLGGTAINMVDYELQTASVTFSNGATANQNCVVRVYDDAAIESDMTAIITYTISGTTDAVAATGNQSHTLTITDNDLLPSDNPGTSSTILSENFEGGSLPVGWTKSQAAGAGWSVGTQASLTSTYFPIPATNATNIAAANDDVCNCDASADYIITSAINTNGFNTLSLAFDAVQPGNYGSSGRVLVSTTSNTGPWTTVHTMAKTSAWTNTVVDLSAYINQTTLYINWHHDDGGAWADGFAIDNVVLSGNDGHADVASTLSESATRYLGPDQTVYFYSGSNNLLCAIENTSSHDYGCTTVNIDRAGSGTTEYASANSAYYLMDKSLLITPTTNNASGTYNISMYFSNSELGGWEAATSESRNDLTIMKTGGAIGNITSGDPGANGITNYNGANSTRGTFAANEYWVKSEFTTGFSGFGSGLENPVPVDIKLLRFEGEKMEAATNRLDWSTASETNNDYFNIQRSEDGERFDNIGKQKGAGTTSAQQSYTYMDRTGAAEYSQYYRLEQVDFDGSVTYTPLVYIQGKADAVSYNVYALKEDGMFNLQVDSRHNGPMTMRVFNAVGQQVTTDQHALSAGANSVRLDLSEQAAGIYFMQFDINGKRYMQKIVRD